MSAPPLTALLALQDLDTAIDQARHRRSHLPARAELEAVAAARRVLDARRAALVVARDEVAGRQDTLERELAATEQRAAEVSRRLYSGAVSAARDLQAMTADIEILTRRASDLEDRTLAVLDEREPLDAAIDAADAEAAVLDGRAAAAEVARADGEAEVDALLADLTTRRAEAAAPLPASLLATYETIRSRLGGIGAAPLVGNHCGGCHLVLPATELDRIKHQHGDEVVTCDQCGRILVRRDPVGP
jgi:predicted  nucleic acid-binding Zn-ribbon protein